MRCVKRHNLHRLASLSPILTPTRYISHRSVFRSSTFSKSQKSKKFDKTEALYMFGFISTFTLAGVIGYYYSDDIKESVYMSLRSYVLGKNNAVIIEHEIDESSGAYFFRNWQTIDKSGNQPINIIVNTYGGFSSYTEFIAEQLRSIKRKGCTVNCFAPYRMASGGLVLGIHGDNIIVSETCIISPADTMITISPKSEDKEKSEQLFDHVPVHRKFEKHLTSAQKVYNESEERVLRTKLHKKWTHWEEIDKIVFNRENKHTHGRYIPPAFLKQCLPNEMTIIDVEQFPSWVLANCNPAAYGDKKVQRSLGEILGLVKAATPYIKKSIDAYFDELCKNNALMRR